jgi:hypothetical protein
MASSRHLSGSWPPTHSTLGRRSFRAQVSMTPSCRHILNYCVGGELVIAMYKTGGKEIDRLHDEQASLY